MLVLSVMETGIIGVLLARNIGLFDRHQAQQPLPALAAGSGVKCTRCLHGCRLPEWGVGVPCLWLLEWGVGVHCL